MKQITAYECEYCGVVTKYEFGHDETRCKAYAEDAERQRIKRDAKIAECKTKALALGAAHVNEILSLQGIVNKYGDSLMRDFAETLYDEHIGHDFSSSMIMENMYTYVIQGALPDYLPG